MDVKTIKIDDIGLSTRASNALHRAGIFTVGDMFMHTEESLLKVRNLGKKSLSEILSKIEEYQKYDSEGSLPDNLVLSDDGQNEPTEDFDIWKETDDGRKFILTWFKERDIKIDALEVLSSRAYNYLFLNDYRRIDQIIFLSKDELMEIPRIDPVSAEEIEKMCRVYLKDHGEQILDDYNREKGRIVPDKQESFREMLYSRENHERILQYVQANDCDVELIGFSVRTRNCLKKNGLHTISDLIFLQKKDFQKIKGMGSGSLQEILSFLDEYLIKHGSRVIAFCDGDDSVLWNEEAVKTIIFDTYNRIGFQGLSLSELREKSNMPEQVSDKMLKSILGSLLADGKLEYVDFRCYRILPKFSDYLNVCSSVKDRNRDIIFRKLRGETLESIASVYDMTRERVRQIVSKDLRNVRNTYRAETGLDVFDEDYYRYFYETYCFDKKDAESWLGISKDVLSYLELTGAEKGTKELQQAVDDSKHLDYGFRLRIKSYLNRNKLFLDGRWIEKKRADLEKYVVWKFCRETVTYDKFIKIYNDFLAEEDIPYDEEIYFTNAVKRTRENKLAGERFLLWKHNRQIRYYDIDGHDFTELLDALNLNAYENVEYSTEKFMIEYPEIMKKYDIRDRYELHNLLRKIVPDGSYHDFHCRKMPTIEFGKFDRDGAMLDLLIDNAPISQADLAEIVHKEYGHDPATIQANYLQSLDVYYHQGMYIIDQKAMTTDHKNALQAKLIDDFYYIDEIRRIYNDVVPDASPEEINPYNLKTMGFSVLSRYVYRNHSSLDSYFRTILTQEDITDITGYRRKYAYVQAFSSTLVDMKNELEVLEFEPNQIISLRKLETAGVSKADLFSFCDEVYEFTSDNDYFSVKSIKKEGFESDLFELGFSDWFYSSILTTDERFSFSTMFGNIVLFKGNERITIKSFEETLIRRHKSIDVYDLMTLMEETYGCKIADRLDLVYKLDGTDVYYDQYLDRLYANIGVFNRELDETEGL